MVSDLASLVFIVELVAIVFYTVWTFRSRQFHLLNRLFLWIALIYAVWVLAMLGLKYTDPNDINKIFTLNCIDYVSYYIPPLYLCSVLVYVRGESRLPKWCRLLFIVPTLSILVVCTNPLHHLHYVVFSVKKSEIVFGPYVYVAGLYSYGCLVAGFTLLIRTALINHSRLYTKQCITFLIGGVVPLVVNAIATFSSLDVPITATPLSFGVTILFNGIAISQLHLLDIQPIATQRILNWITDCYLILSDKGLVVGYNKPFEEVFATPYGIKENRYLRDFAKEEDISNKTPIYNIISAVETCSESMSVISYEQALTVTVNGATQKNYYLIDVTPLVIDKRPSGFVVIFKDITLLKKSMQQLNDSRARMMEQERFAFLGQMMGGLAHNLKTPIMSISGCLSAADGLIDEYLESLDDPQVNSDDYREIYGEIRDWLEKAREATSYMSDIITAIKGQANSVSAFEDAVFTVDELIKRTTLLMRHELSYGGCTLDVKVDPQLREMTLHGDVNNLIQVLNNLLSNAIYAQKQMGGGVITLEVEKDEANLTLRVRDRGPGVSPNIRRRLFREMVTNKGAMGSGLGLYISNTVVRGKFNGTMWMEDNPGGGSVFGVTIPLEKPAAPASEL